MARSLAVRASAVSNGWAAKLERTKGGDDERGPLSGLSFALKDMYSLRGHTNGCGNPTWLQTHSPALENAPPLEALQQAGAQLVGMTHMDELAYSLNGENVHYGTPTNAAAGGRVPGGSSSGSASTVACGEVDFAVGSDTAGSVRIPASYQGLFGFRPTHGRISMQHAVPLAPSFDTCGWFARDAGTLQRVGHVLLESQQAAAGDTAAPRWLVAADAFDSVAPPVSQAMYMALSTDFAAVQSLLGPPQEVRVTEEGESLEDWLACFRTLQSAEVWASHGAWIQEHSPEFGPGIRERFDAASRVTAGAVAEAKTEQKRIRKRVEALFQAGTFMTLPSAPGPAPLKGSSGPELEAFRVKALALTSVAGLCGLPQVSIPCATVDGFPVGLGIIGPVGSDEQLLQLTVSLAACLEL